uniref:Histone H4 n=1 Tax=Panagrolaimus sp. PS1159 TaxID=55785 RepID=A0AC35GMR5_9BILA
MVLQQKNIQEFFVQPEASPDTHNKDPLPLSFTALRTIGRKSIESPKAVQHFKGHKIMRRKKTEMEGNAGMNLPSIKRLARRAGVKRISAAIDKESRAALKDFVASVMKDAIILTAYAKRNTVTVMDVIYALKKRGTPLYW